MEETADVIYPWLECDPAIASDLAGVLMDAFADVDNEDVYEVSVPSAVVEWIEKHLGNFTTTDGMNIDELEFSQVMFQAVFVFLGGVIGKSLCDHGHAKSLIKLGAAEFLRRPRTAKLVPIAEIEHVQTA